MLDSQAGQVEGLFSLPEMLFFPMIRDSHEVFSYLGHNGPYSCQLYEVWV